MRETQKEHYCKFNKTQKKRKTKQNQTVREIIESSM
jgi:hypothetical protein